MHNIKENDIGQLLAKMRERQNKIKKSMEENNIIRPTRKSISITNTHQSNVPTTSFDSRLQRIRNIRKKLHI